MQFKPFIVLKFYNLPLHLQSGINRAVAQPGSAHVWGAWGRKFESCHPDYNKSHLILMGFVITITY